MTVTEHTTQTLGAAAQRVAEQGGALATGFYDLIFDDQSANAGPVQFTRAGRVVVGGLIAAGLVFILWRLK